MRDLLALHKHWCAADAVKLSVAAPVHDGLPNWPEDLIALSKIHTQFLRVSVWYALLYVVIEGYRELKAADAAIDALLADQVMEQALRRFRNATFHFQEDPVGPKLMEFLQAPDSEKWVHQLHAAFGTFFANTPPIKEALETLGSRGGA